VEITVEVNPGTVDADFFKAFVEAGGNRVHVGVQSFSDERLAFLGRMHRTDQARRALETARAAGVENLGIDLIYGLPAQGRKGWIHDLNNAIAYEPEHLSCYMLTYEAGTLLDQRRRAGVFAPLEEEQVAALFEETIGYLSKNDYKQYEISNYSKKGLFPSRHNRKYWRHHPYIGLGPSAHSFIPFQRWWNVNDCSSYLHRLQSGKTPVKEREFLTRNQQMLEAFFLGVRTVEGVDLPDLEKRFGVPFKNSFHHMGRLLKDRNLEDLLRVSEKRCQLTPRGQVFADTVTGVFAECIGI
jgi:oxygen-independent coproporphyrinogen-3 oxidase